MRMNEIINCPQIRNEAVVFLKRAVTDAEWAEAFPQAKRKLDYLIEHNQEETATYWQPWYLGKLVEEAIVASAMTRHCVERNACIEKKKAASEESKPIHNNNSISREHWQSQYREGELL